MGIPELEFNLNQKVQIWVSGKLGQQVKVKGGKGTCWDLAELALKQAGAKTSNDFGRVGPNANYVWGDPVEIAKVKAGDILQIGKHVQKTETVIEFIFSDGSKQKERHLDTGEFHHHTAIVNDIMDPSTGAIPTLEQNRVHVSARHTAWLVQKSVIYTRDVPAIVTTSYGQYNVGMHKFDREAKVTRTVTVTVEGKKNIWAYRPIAK